VSTFRGSPLSGYLAVVAASVLFGAWATVGTVLNTFLDPLASSFYVQVIPGILFLPFLRPSRFSRRDGKVVAFLVLTGSVLGPVLYFQGLNRTTPTNGVLLQNTEALFTILLAFLFLRERLARRAYLAIAAIAAGAFIVTTDLRLDLAGIAASENLVGNLMLIGSALCWASNNNIVTVLSRRIPIPTIIAVQLVLGAPLLAPFMVGLGISFGPPVDQLPILVAVGLAMIGLFSLLFYYAFRTIGAMRTGAVLSVSSVWGLLIALAVFPGIGITTAQIVGGGLMVPALVALYLWEPRAPSPAQAADASSAETLKHAPSDGPRSP
jgi:drug/metabolite transporter (DMT)-like permease